MADPESAGDIDQRLMEMDTPELRYYIHRRRRLGPNGFTLTFEDGVEEAREFSRSTQPPEVLPEIFQGGDSHEE